MTIDVKENGDSLALREKQLIAKVSTGFEGSQEQKLMKLVRDKGCIGWTAFVHLLASAKSVDIKT